MSALVQAGAFAYISAAALTFFAPTLGGLTKSPDFVNRISQLL
jgi:hypothetical protein